MSEAWRLGGWSFVVDHMEKRENVNKLGEHNQSQICINKSRVLTTPLLQCSIIRKKIIGP